LIAAGQAVATVDAGMASFVVAGGVDTYRDLWILGTLDQKERVKSEANLDGFIPGEGAAFVVVSTAETAARYGLTALGRISPVASGFEAGHLESTEPYRGDGLAATIGQLVRAGAIAEPISEVYSSMNGESHWAKEWGVSYLRHRAFFDPGHGMHHPADCYGDLGAAAGPTMLVLAALGARDRYRRSPTLVYGSSDRGPRAAIVVSGVH
jgi:3-oxoacyl-[acyl-carrier-protein] synthase-1